MQPCGGGTRTREGALVSTIIRVSSRRMSFINARGKLRPYTCIYTRVREGRERGRERSGGVVEKEYGEGDGGGGRGENDGGEVSIVLLRPRGLGALPLRLSLPPPPTPPASSRSLFYYYYFLSQYLLFPHSVLC